MEIDYLPVTIDPILQLKTASYLNQWKTSFLVGFPIISFVVPAARKIVDKITY
jgi:glutamate mutase epsilon subunit